MQVTLSRAFALDGSPRRRKRPRAPPKASLDAESIDDIELAPVTENAETRRKKPRAGGRRRRPRRRQTKRRDASRQTLSCFSAATRTSRRRRFRGDVRARDRTASAFSIGVLFRDVVGRRRFGFRRTRAPNPTRPAQRSRAAESRRWRRARPRRRGLASRRAASPTAVGVLPLGADVPDAGDGVGGVLFAFPVVSRRRVLARFQAMSLILSSRRSASVRDNFEKYSLRPEHARALASALRAGNLPAVAFHAQAVFKALSALGVCCEPLLARLTVLDARAMAWLRAPRHAPHEGGVGGLAFVLQPSRRARRRPRRRRCMVNESRHAYERRSERSGATWRRRRHSRRGSGARRRAARACARTRPCARGCADDAPSRSPRRTGSARRDGTHRDRLRRRVRAARRDALPRRNPACRARGGRARGGKRGRLARELRGARAGREALFVTLRLPAPPVLKATESAARQLSTRGRGCCARSRPSSARAPWSAWWCATAPRRARRRRARYVSTHEKRNGSSTEGAIGRLRCGGTTRARPPRGLCPVRTPTSRRSVACPSQNRAGASADDGNACVSLRGAFVAPEGRVLLAADYSQIELRVLEKPGSARDILATRRRRSRAKIRPPDAFGASGTRGRGFPASAPVTRADRAKAKTTVYGLLYGQGEAGLAHKLGVSREELEGLGRALCAPRSRRCAGSCARDARRARRRRGAFLPLAARLGRFPGSSSARTRRARAEAERRAVNTLVQGTAADLVKVANDGATIGRRRPPLRRRSEADDDFPASSRFQLASRRARVRRWWRRSTMSSCSRWTATRDASRQTAQCARACMEGAAEELGLTGLWTPTQVTVGKTWETLVPIGVFSERASEKRKNVFGRLSPPLSAFRVRRVRVGPRRVDAASPRETRETARVVLFS